MFKKFNANYKIKKAFFSNSTNKTHVNKDNSGVFSYRNIIIDKRDKIEERPLTFRQRKSSSICNNIDEIPSKYNQGNTSVNQYVQRDQKNYSTLLRLFKNNNRKKTYSFNELAKIKLIQRIWQASKKKKNKAAKTIQKVLKGNFTRRILNQIRYQNKTIERMISIMQSVCFAHCFKIIYNTGYMIRKKAKIFLAKLLKIQRWFRYHYEIKLTKLVFWKNYNTMNSRTILKRPLINGFTGVKITTSLYKLVMIQKQVRLFIKRLKEKKRIKTKCRINKHHFLTKAIKMNNRSTKSIKPQFSKIRVLNANYAFYTKEHKKPLKGIIMIQKAIKKFLALLAYQKRIRTISKKSNQNQMFIDKKKLYNRKHHLIMIQTTVKLFLMRKNLQHLRFNKTQVMPSIYTKDLIYKSIKRQLTQADIQKEIEGNIIYFSLKLMLVAGLALKKIGFKQLIKIKPFMKFKPKMPVKPKEQWSFSFNNDDVSYEYYPKSEFCSIEGDDNPEMVPNPICHLDSMQLLKSYKLVSCSSRLKSKDTEINDENQTYGSLIKLKPFKEIEKDNANNSNIQYYFDDN